MLKQLYNNLEIWRAEKLAQKTRKFHMAPPSMCQFNIKITNLEGKVIKNYTQLTHSYTRNFLNFMAMTSMLQNITNTGTGYQDGSLRIKGTDGTVSGATTSVFTYSWNSNPNTTTTNNVDTAFRLAPLNNDTKGIVLGTSNTAENIDDFRMESLIGNGTGAGQMTYQLQVADSAIYNAATKKWSVDYTRAFHNVSGGAITVREIGCVSIIADVFSAGRNCCIIRDVLTTPVIVGDGEKISITYRFSYLVSN